MKNRIARSSIRFISVTLLVCLVLVCSACKPAPTIDNFIQFRDIQGLIAVLIDPAQKLYDRNRAAEALGEFGDRAAIEPLRQALLAWVTAGTNDLGEVGTAAEALGKLGDKQAVDPLIVALEAKRWDTETRTDIIAALGALRDSRIIMPLLQSVPGKGDEPGEIYYVVRSAIAGLGDEAISALTKALPSLRGTCLRHQVATEVLSQLAQPQIPSILEKELHAAEQCSKRNAAAALYIVYEQDVNQILPYLKSRDTVAVYTQIIRVGKAGTEAALLTALQQFGSKQMAQDYLNSGNAQLSAAAKDWALKHGYYLQAVPGSGQSTWGK